MTVNKKLLLGLLLLLSFVTMFQVGCKKSNEEIPLEKSSNNVNKLETKDISVDHVDKLNHEVFIAVNNSVQTIDDKELTNATIVESVESLIPRFSEDKLVERSVDQCFLTGVINSEDRDTTKSVVFSQDEVKTLLLGLDKELSEPNLSILGLVEIGPASMYVFYEIEQGTYVSEISYESQENFSKEKLKWRLDDTRIIQNDIHKIYKDVNTIWFDLVLDTQRYLIATNHEFQEIQSIQIPDDLKLVDIFYGVENNKLLTTMIIQKLKTQVVVNIDYDKKENGDIHYIHVGEKVFADGKHSGEWWHYHNYFDLYYNKISGVVVRLSNQNLVIKPVAKINEQMNTYQDGDIFWVRDEALHNIFIENLNDELPKEDLRYSKDIFGGMWKRLTNGDYIYIDKKTEELVRVDSFNVIQERSQIPHQYLSLLLKDENNSNTNWSIINDGVGIFYYPDGEVEHEQIVYYSYDKHEFIEVDIPLNTYASMDNNMIYYSNKRMKRLDFTDFTFKRYYKNYEEEFPREGIVFNDIFYYPDSEKILGKEDESILKDDSFLPAAQLPKIVINGREEQMLDVQSFNQINYIVTMENKWLCIGKFGESEYISDFAIRDMDGDSEGVVYVGYEENTSGYYYDVKTNEVYLIPVETIVDDIRLMNDVIIVLSNNELLTYSRIKLVNGSEALENKLDLVTYIEATGSDEFFIDENGQIIIAYIDRDAGYLVLPSQTFLLSKDLDLIDQVNCSYNYSYDAGMYLSAPPYAVRYNFATGDHEILKATIFGGAIQGYHHGYFVMNDAYEGAGTTWLHVPEYIVEENLEFESGEKLDIEPDYTLVLSSIHQSYVVLIDHKRKKVVYLANVWSVGKYKLLEDGIEFTEYNQKQFVPLPIDGVIDVVVGFTL